MTKKLFRGSFFICLMFVLSITLTGCSFSDIVDGFKNTFGSVFKGVGNIVSSVAKVAQGVIKVVKPVVTAVSDAISGLTGKENKFGEKINSALDKVGDIAGKVDEFGQKIKETGEKLKGEGGNDGDDSEDSSSDVNNPTQDDEDEVATDTADIGRTPEDNSDEQDPENNTDGDEQDPNANPSENTEDPDQTLDNPEDETTEDPAAAAREELKAEILKGIEALEKDIDNAGVFMIEEKEALGHSNNPLTWKKDAVVSILNQLSACKKVVAECKKDPLSQKSRAHYTLLADNLLSIKKQVEEMNARSKFVKAGLIELMNRVEDAYKTLFSSYLNVN